MHQPQPILAKNVDLWRWEWQRSSHYAVRSPLEPAKSRKASIKLRRLAPNRGIHRYPRDTERHKSTFLARIGFFNLKTPIPCKRPPATRRRRAQQTKTKKTQCCRPEQSGRRSVAASRPSAGKGARPSRRAGRPPGRPTRRHCVGRATAPDRAPGGDEPRPRSSA